MGDISTTLTHLVAFNYFHFKNYCQELYVSVSANVYGILYRPKVFSYNKNQKEYYVAVIHFNITYTRTESRFGTSEGYYFV